MIIEVGRQYELPEGPYQQPVMTVTVVNVEPGEWVAYKNYRCNGRSRYDYFEQNAREVPPAPKLQPEQTVLKFVAWFRSAFRWSKSARILGRKAPQLGANRDTL